MVTQSAGSVCCGNSQPLLAALFFVPAALLAQLTTGTIEGTLRDLNGHPLAASTIVVSGAVGFHAVIHSNSNGSFVITLPYGRYRLSGEVQHDEGSTPLIFIGPLQNLRVDLVAEASGSIRVTQTAQRTPEAWTDVTSGRVYPEGFSLLGILLSREPSTVTEPLDFTGLSDNRPGGASQRGFSWADTQYKLHGMDATDSYQPGLPMVLPDVQALDTVVVRSAFAQTLAQPLVVLVVLLTSDKKVMGSRTNSRGAMALGWICAGIMSAAAVALLVILSGYLQHAT